MLKNSVTLKTRLGIVQGRWKWRQWRNNCPCRPCNAGRPARVGGLVPTPPKNWWKLVNLSTLLHLLKHARRNISNDSSEWFRPSKWTERWWLLAYLTWSKMVWYYQSINQSSNQIDFIPRRRSYMNHLVWYMVNWLLVVNVNFMLLKFICDRQTKLVIHYDY